jgi:transcriptional regulator with XRE-family HTH domain
MKNTESEFSRKLRDLRLNGKYKYSQALLGQLAGVTSSYISQLETGKKKPTPSVIRKVSKHLGINPNVLLSTIGMVEMDLSSTLASKREQISREMPDLKPEQKEELANYLTYLEFKSHAIQQVPT